MQSLVGDTAITLTGYVNSNHSLADDLNRYIYQTCPGCRRRGARRTALRRGAGAQPVLVGERQLGAGSRGQRDAHARQAPFTLSGSTYAGITTSTPLVLSGTSALFVRPSTFATASRQVQFSDQFKVNDKLTLGPNISYAGTTGSGSSLLGGFSASWRPTNSDSYSASVSVGSSQAANGIVRSFSDPNSARVNCFANTAQVSGPGDQPSHQSALSYDASWTHVWSHGQFSVSAYRQDQAGQLVNAQVTAASLGLFPGDPYFDAVAATTARYAPASRRRRRSRCTCRSSSAARRACTKASPPPRASASARTSS